MSFPVAWKVVAWKVVVWKVVVRYAAVRMSPCGIEHNRSTENTQTPQQNSFLLRALLRPIHCLRVSPIASRRNRRSLSTDLGSTLSRAAEEHLGDSRLIPGRTKLAGRKWTPSIGWDRSRSPFESSLLSSDDLTKKFSSRTSRKPSGTASAARIAR